jgi:hypothetical protein
MAKEKILSIQDCNFNTESGRWATDFEGFIIETDKQKILIGISSGQSCCESSGYLSSEDNFEEYIGARLNSITTTDTVLITNDVVNWDFDGGGIMFVNVETSKGTLQFAVYNSHNGYYGHSVIIKSNQLTINSSL